VGAYGGHTKTHLLQFHHFKRITDIMIAPSNVLKLDGNVMISIPTNKAHGHNARPIKGLDIDPVLPKVKAKRSVPLLEKWTMVNDRESYRVAAGLIFQRVSGITACDMTSARSLTSSVGQYWLTKMKAVK
jgi:hypothetical protein